MVSPLQCLFRGVCDPGWPARAGENAGILLVMLLICLVLVLIVSKLDLPGYNETECVVEACSVKISWRK